MPWGRVDDSAYTHPKFLGLDPAAVGLWAMALSYCNDHLTDGFIPREQVSRLITATPSRALRLANGLVTAGLWENRGTAGFQVHDYLDWNDSADEVRAKRATIAEARSRAGRIGGVRSAEVRRSKRASKPEANHEANASGVLEAKRSPLHSTPLIPPIVPPSPLGSTSTTNGADPSATPRGWMPPPGTIYHDGCAKPGFAHLFPPERRALCPKHQVGQETAPEEPGK